MKNEKTVAERLRELADELEESAECEEAEPDSCLDQWQEQTVEHGDVLNYEYNIGKSHRFTLSKLNEVGKEWVRVLDVVDEVPFARTTVSTQLSELTDAGYVMRRKGDPASHTYEYKQVTDIGGSE